VTQGERPLDGRVALVTGAARGIGRSIAVRLAEAGAEVAITSRDSAQLEGTIAEIAALGGKPEPIALDLQHTDGAEVAMAQAADRFGHVDVVVANSGIGGPTAAPASSRLRIPSKLLVSGDEEGTMGCLRVSPRYLVLRSIAYILTFRGERAA
jgi:NAD(P)-dependent dehydrogenase (short-subunit alcohol dehydrogenase family)